MRALLIRFLCWLDDWIATAIICLQDTNGGIQKAREELRAQMDNAGSKED